MGNRSLGPSTGFPAPILLLQSRPSHPVLAFSADTAHRPQTKHDCGDDDLSGAADVVSAILYEQMLLSTEQRFRFDLKGGLA